MSATPAFGHVAIEPKKTSRLGHAFWATCPREGFTEACRQAFGDFLSDDVSDREVQVIVQRGDWLAAIDGARQAKQNGAIRRAAVLS